MINLFRAARAALFLFVAVLPLAGSADEAPQRPVAVSQLSFVSGGKTIRADLYESPQDAAAAPKSSARTILVLHGAGGMLFDGPEMRRVAGRLAQDGNRVYVVHYFNRTGTLVSRDAVLRKLFLPEWLPTVRDAVTWAYNRQDGAKRPIGIFGYSLGAFAAVAAASDDPRVGIVVEQSGGIWNNQEQRIGHHMPPVLMIHGRDDRRVPFGQYATQLQTVLRRRGGTVETCFYPGEGHRFFAPAAARVREQAADFFSRKCRRET